MSRVVRPLQRFLQTEVSSGVFLLATAAAGLVWANVLPSSYETVWHTTLTIGVGDWAITEDLRHWIGDALMALFFFVVGLEIKRELVSGELRDRRAAILPIAGAVGGMIVPALIYLTLNSTGGGSRGWGVPMATDIAFALGVLAVAGRGLPSGLRLFLLTLAIVDDIGAIVVIAIFYTESLSVSALAIGVAALAVMAAMRRFQIHARGVYLILGFGVWLAVFHSGVHATIAGVALAFLTPAVARGGPSPLVRFEELLHPWTSFVIVPLFALANAGVRLSRPEGSSLRVATGVVLGLLLGKVIGIALGAAIATRAGLARLPEGVGWNHVLGVSALGGIGFTVSLFIASLAFGDAPLLRGAKLGVLVGSLLSGVTGSVLLARTKRKN